MKAKIPYINFLIKKSLQSHSQSLRSHHILLPSELSSHSITFQPNPTISTNAFLSNLRLGSIRVNKFIDSGKIERKKKRSPKSLRFGRNSGITFFYIIYLRNYINIII